MTNTRGIVMQNNFQHSCVVWMILAALDQPGPELRTERGVDAEDKSVVLVYCLEDIIYLPNRYDSGIVNRSGYIYDHYLDTTVRNKHEHV